MKTVARPMMDEHERWVGHLFKTKYVSRTSFLIIVITYRSHIDRVTVEHR
jgi:hypothetical protein